MSSMGIGFPRNTFFFYPNDIFADFFKFIINQYNLSNLFEDTPIIKRYIYFESYHPSNSTPNPFYSFIAGTNAKLLKSFNPFNIFLLNIFIILGILFFQIRNFLIEKKIVFIIFFSLLFSYALLHMINRGHVFSGFLGIILIQLVINTYNKKNFLYSFIFILLAFCARPTTLCFALLIFNYNFSLNKKIGFFFLSLISAPFFFILINEINFILFDNLHSFFQNFNETLKIHSFDRYFNLYVIKNAGLAFGSSLWGPVKVFLITFTKINLHGAVYLVFILCSLIFALFTLLFFLKEIEFKIYAYIVASYYILSTPVSADYHLIVFIGPLLLFFKDYPAQNNKNLYFILIIYIAVILSPFHYYFNSQSIVIPEKTLTNPIIILLSNLYILMYFRFYRYNRLKKIIKKLNYKLKYLIYLKKY